MEPEITNPVDSAISMFAILSIAAVIVGGLIVFLVIYLNKSKKIIMIILFMKIKWMNKN